MKKEKIRKRICSIEAFYEDIDNFIETLKELKETYTYEGFEELTIELEEESEPYDPSTYWRLLLYGKRFETDEEFEKRKNEIEIHKKRQEERELLELKRLEEKYRKERE